VFLSCLVLSCQTEQLPEVKPSNVSQFTDPLTLELDDEDMVLLTLKKSDAWAKVGNDLKTRIDHSRKITLSSFENSSVQVISIYLKTSFSFEAIIFYTDGTSFFPAVAKSKSAGELNYLALTDLNGKPYYDFYSNRDNRMGKFKVHNDLKLAGFEDDFRDRSRSSLGKEAEPTCMEKTDSFGSCMLCAINECASDWVCAVVCTVMSAQCLAGFGLGCALFD